jgi:hypothetical protein
MYVSRTVEIRNVYKILVGKLTGRDNLEDLDVDAGASLKMSLAGCEGVDWIQRAQD